MVNDDRSGTDSSTSGNRPDFDTSGSSLHQHRAAFGAECSSGRRPRIEDYLVRAREAERDSLFEDLLAMELESRRRRGENPDIDEYASRFPDRIDAINRHLASTAESDDKSLASTVIFPSAARRCKRSAFESDSSLGLSASQSLGRYRLEERLGRGGFGEVWRGFDPELHRHVAVKFPRVDRTMDGEVVDRFVAEARRIACLKCPGVVPVYDVGRADGRIYIVSEFIDGGTLGDRVKAGPLPFEESARIVAEIAQTLHQAHLNDIVHRDIKPANILLDENGRPFVTDFGLAVTEEEQLGESASVMGTFAYMSPEQAMGRSHRVDARSDIYSLGMVFYLLLTQRLPFIAKSHEEYRDQIVNREPRPPRTIDDSIPAELERICLKCVAKSIADRYPTAADLALELRASLSSTVSDTSRGWRWTAVSAAVVATLLAIVGAIVTASHFLSPEQADQENLEAGASGGASIATESPDHATDVTARKSTDESEPSSVDVDPFGWTERLGSRPHELVWPGYRGNATLGFREEIRAYEISSDAVRLVSLGELSEGSYTLSVAIRQPVWVGSAGVFMGYGHTEQEGRPAARLQSIIIDRNDEKEKPPMLQIRRAITIVSPTLGKTLTHAELGYHDVPYPAGGSAVRLELEINESGLIAARWGNEELSGLTGDYHNGRLKRADYTGPWGLLTQYGTTFYQDPVIITHEEHQE